MRTTAQYIAGQAIAAVVVNLALSSGIAWLIYRGLTDMPLPGETSIVGDTLVTGFLLPLLVALIITPAVRKDVAAGRVAPMPGRKMRLPSNAFAPGLILELAAVVTLTPIVFFTFDAIGIESLRLRQFVIF